MRLTSTHARFWQSKQPAPAWVKAAILPKLPVPDATVHACINAHAGIKIAHLDAGNLLALLRMKRRQGGTLQDYLGTLVAFSPDAKRRAIARRWRRRIGGPVGRIRGEQYRFLSLCEVCGKRHKHPMCEGEQQP